MFHALIAGFAAAVLAAGEAPPTLTLEQALAQARTGLAEARLAVDLAELEADLGQTRGLLREGPSLATQAGWRRQSPDGDGADFGLEIELPLASKASRAGRASLADALGASRETLGRAAAATDRQKIVEAYLALWGAQRRAALRQDDERLLREFAGRLREQIAAGAVAAFHSGLIDAELRAAQGLAAEALAEEGLAWAKLLALADLPAVPIPWLERPSWTAAAPAEPQASPAPAGPGSLVAESLRAEQRLADSRSLWSQSRQLSRSGVAASLAREGDEDVVLVGWRWRIPFEGERQALERRTAGEISLREIAARQQLAELEGRRRSSRALLAALPAGAEDPQRLEAVWQAAELRVREGKDSPAEAMSIRRALISAQITALDLELRRLAAQAELAYLSLETRP